MPRTSIAAARTTATLCRLYTGTLVRAVFSAILFLLLAAPAVMAQTTSHTGSESTTPNGLAPGAPAGAYALSGFEHINLYNGNLDFHLPLLQLGGRGSAGYTMMLALNTKSWSVRHSQTETTETWTPTSSSWADNNPGYTPGRMRGRKNGFDTQYLAGCTGLPVGKQFYQTTLTTLTFTAADGTEYNFRDQLSGGARLTAQHCPPAFPYTGASRGQVWVTTDGSAATFISSSNIYDQVDIPSGVGPRTFKPYGTMLLRDGTRYTISNGEVTAITDRNGNTVTPGIDALGRTISIEYDVSDPTYGLCDRIHYNGFGGAPRTLYVTKAHLGDPGILRSGYAPLPYSSLFPELGGSLSYGTNNYNPTVTTGVVLPNGQSYSFRYNSYGELARVVLPTGGAIEYDMVAGSGVVSGNNNEGAACEIYRRVAERRTYTDGTTLTGRTVYTAHETDSPIYIGVDNYDAAGTMLTSERHYFHGIARESVIQMLDGLGFPVDTYPAWDEGRESLTEVYDTNGTSATTLLRWSGTTWQAGGTLGGFSINPRAVTTTTAVEPNGANLVTKQTAINPANGNVGFDQYNNQTDAWEYDYGTGAASTYAVRHTHTDYLTVNPANGIDYTAYTGAHLRGLPTVQQVYAVNPTNGAESVVAATYTGYDQVGLSDCPGIVGHDAAFATTYTTRGNVTHATSYADAAQLTGAVDTWLAYDIAGNLIQSTDPRGNASWTSYTDNFADGVGRNTYAFPKTTTSAIPDTTNSGRATNSSLTTTTVYDYATGHVVATTDANGQVTTADYSNDALDRLKQVTRPDGGRTQYFYNDMVGNLYLRTLTDQDATRAVEAYQFFDGLGRGVRTFLNVGGAFSTTDTQYDALGRTWRVSNPYLTGGSGDPVNPADKWTTTIYDALGRVVTVTTPDNAVVSTAYNGNTVTVTDQKGKQRKSVSDGLGRLTSVYEDPAGLNYQTSYDYDALGNLRQVTQGSQHRYFMYDSLSRLVRAKNPEQLVNASLNTSADPVSGNYQWSLAYSYDANGNLATKTDARGVTAIYLYDNLNRVIQTSYTDGTTPYTLNTYDCATNGRGRYCADYESSTTGTINYVTAYDAVGRPTQRNTQFYVNGSGWATGFNSTREYDKAGHVTHETYPSGHTVNYHYDAAGRVGDDSTGYAFSGTLGDGTLRTYAQNVVYDAASRLAGERFGTQTPLYHMLGYNVRGQLYLVQLGTGSFGNWNRGMLATHYSVNDYTQWGASGPDNNGDVLRTHHYVPNDDQLSGWAVNYQDYTYDSLNRLSSVTEIKDWSTGGGGYAYQQGYSYDRWGNRTINQAQTWGSGINNLPFNVDAATNRLTPGGAGTLSYDAAGNQTFDNYSTGTAAVRRLYDAENRLTETQTASSQTVSKYTYDAAGQRMRRETGGVVTWQVYGFDGELVAEYAASAAPASPQKEYGYRNGELLITAEPAYQLVARHSGKCLEVGGASQANTAGLYQWGCWGGANQQWRFVPTDSGYNKLVAQHSGKVADIEGASTANGARIQQYDYLGGANQQWQLVPTDSGYYRVVSRYSGKVLDVAGVSTADGAQVQQWDYWGGGNQQWQLVPTATVEWLVADQLGTPRMVVDQSGSLASVKRHDYLPFGEEVGAGIGGRTTGQGYSISDGVKQKFTGKERDNETGLDYSIARYYSPVQGRFSSPDPVLSSGQPATPQSWNRYTYCLNHPLVLVDPDGLIWGTYEKDGQTHLHWYGSQKELEAAGSTVYNGPLIYQDSNNDWISLNPNAGQWTRSYSEWDAKKALWHYTGLPPSWQDHVPVWGQARLFLFNYAAGNYETALGNFFMAAAEGGTMRVGSSATAAKAFATEAGEAIFYSGRGAAAAAEAIIEAEGGRTIERTIGGKILGRITRPIPGKVELPSGMQDAIWKWGSKYYASGASGTVRAVLRPPLRPNNTWEFVEYPILKVNPFARIVER